MITSLNDKVFQLKDILSGLIEDLSLGESDKGEKARG